MCKSSFDPFTPAISEYTVIWFQQIENTSCLENPLKSILNFFLL